MSTASKNPMVYCVVAFFENNLLVALQTPISSPLAQLRWKILQSRQSLPFKKKMKKSAGVVCSESIPRRFQHCRPSDVVDSSPLLRDFSQSEIHVYEPTYKDFLRSIGLGLLPSESIWDVRDVKTPAFHFYQGCIVVEVTYFFPQSFEPIRA